MTTRIVSASKGTVYVDSREFREPMLLTPEEAFELAAELQHRATRAMIQLERDGVYD